MRIRDNDEGFFIAEGGSGGRIADRAWTGGSGVDRVIICSGPTALTAA